jgi:hypothetical protein
MDDVKQHLQSAIGQERVTEYFFREAPGFYHWRLNGKLVLFIDGMPQEDPGGESPGLASSNQLTVEPAAPARA